MEILAVLIVLAIVYGMSFLVTSGIVYLICWVLRFCLQLAAGPWMLADFDFVKKHF